MTGKPAMTENDGPGVRANRARIRRMVWFMIGYAVVAIAFMIYMRSNALPTSSGPAKFPPNVALVAGALFPLLFGGAMVFIWRMLDEVAHRVAQFAWAGAFLFTAFATISWSFLWQGGWVPEPNAMAILVASAVVVMILALLKQRLG
jgi:NhaP-type Na+/H+ or K+/H+ antiporter